MDAIQALTMRVSAPRLGLPMPSEQQLSIIRRSALRAADHGNLRPWRFLEVVEEGLNLLGKLYLEAALLSDEGLNDAQQQRFKSLPLRAPMVIVAIAKIQDHPKVPRDEQLVSAGCAVQNMLNAAFALNLGAYWRTGELALSRHVAEGLGLMASEEIIGFLYLGSIEGAAKQTPQLDPEAFFSRWPKLV